MNNVKKYFNISNKKVLIISLALMSFSIGIWNNYRGIWLKSNIFLLTDVGNIISCALICSSIIIIIITLISSKIRIKKLIIEIMHIRINSLFILLITNNIFIIILCVILSIICEVIFSLSFYPLLSFEDNSDLMYRKKSVVEYFSMDIGIIFCGFLLGLFAFNYDHCLLLSLISSILSLIILNFYNNNSFLRHKDNNSLKVAIKNILSIKSNKLFLLSSFFAKISYGIVFDLMIIILINNLYFDDLSSSIYIIINNMIGNFLCLFLNKINNKITINNGILIKFGTRVIFYLFAFIFNKKLVFILSISISYITSKILDNKVTGVFIRENKNKDKFTFENIRYFIESFAEGIGILLASILLGISLRVLFLCAALITIIQIVFLLYNSKYVGKY